MKKTSKKKSSVVSVDFKGVQAGGGSRLLPEGPILLEIVDISQEEGQESGAPYLAFEFEAVDEGGKVWDNMSLSAKALWKFRGFLDALGVETEDSSMDIDLDDLVGMTVVGHIAHEEYKGKTKNRVVGYESAEDDTTAPAKKETTPKKKVAKKAETEDEGEADFKLGQTVQFKDGRKKVKGDIVGIDGDTLTVEVDGEEYEIDAADVLE